MPEYRTPEEEQRQAEQAARIQQVLDVTVRDAVSLKTAMVLAEPADVVEMWIDRTWDGLRDALAEEDRVVAILLLLDERINTETLKLLRGMREVGDA